MPRRKKLPTVPDYKDGGKNPSKLLVQKTNPLLTLSETDMTLPELKILDAYLARIDSHDPDKRYIRLEKGAIEKLLGVTQIKPQDLEKRIKNLFQTIRIIDENKPKGFTLIALFEKAVCFRDDDGLWQVDLAASGSAMEYIFNPENLGYLRYRLANGINLTSRYSYVLYLYLESNRFRGSWEVGLDELKELLRCTAYTCSQFFRFNGLILKKCHQELNEKTTLHFDYEPVKAGRTVRAVRFTLHSVRSAPTDEGQLSMFDAPEDEEPEEPAGWSSMADVVMDATGGRFTKAECEEIASYLVKVDPNVLPYNESRELQIFDAARSLVLKLNTEEEWKAKNGDKIARPKSYIIGMIKKLGGNADE